MRRFLPWLFVLGGLWDTHLLPAVDASAEESEVSPRGDILLQLRTDANETKEIWLASAADSTRSRLLAKYDRSATVLFSPGERWLVLDAHSGSSESEVILYRQKAPLDYERVADLSNAAWSFFRRQNHWTTSWLFDHYYVDALRWADDDPPTLLLCLTGHLDPRHYTDEWYCFYNVRTRTFGVDLKAHNRKVTRLQRKARSSHTRKERVAFDGTRHPPSTPKDLPCCLTKGIKVRFIGQPAPSLRGKTARCSGKIRSVAKRAVILPLPASPRLFAKDLACNHVTSKVTPPI